MKKTIFIFLALSLLLIVSCKKKTEDMGVQADLSFPSSPLTDYWLTKVKYTWNLKDNFKGFNKNLYAFVHFSDSNNRIILQDDHLPPVETTKWKAGDRFEYEREIFLPKFIDEFDPSFKGEEEVKLTIGLWDPFNPSTKHIVLIKKLKFQPPPVDTPEIIFENGWYPEERDPQRNISWRWTSKEAKCTMDNPRRETLLWIKGGVNKAIFQDQRVVFIINERVIDDFIPETGEFDRRYYLTPDELEDNDEVILTIRTDKTFIPSKSIPNSTDPRELGVMIYLIYFR
ncbi:MAG: hypothetical protein ACUVUG_05630 [Candidatus Aminicenantia bacterium]